MNEIASPAKNQSQTNLLLAGGILQRKCACGNHMVAGGECAECEKKKSGLQRKLTLGASNDPLEREADRVADQVMATPAHPDVSNAPPRIQRFSEQLNEEQMETAPTIVDQALASPGRPLEPALRQDMEQRFGYNFSRVRVYSDKVAEQSSDALNANAYTVGHNIVFGTSRFAPGTHEGRRLIAHELTHVVQQSATTGIRVEDKSNKKNSLLAISTQHLPLAAVQRQRASPEDMQTEEESSGLWGTIGGGLIGEFNEDPNFAMIGVDVGVSLIPVLDQASDARDIVAHLYYLIAERQYNRFLRWLGLVFTLIGLVPEVGSAIKGASRFILRGIGEALSHLSDLLRPFRALLPEVADLSRLQRYIRRHWNGWVATGLTSWNRAMDGLRSIFSHIPVFLGSRARALREAFELVREQAPRELNTAFAWVRQQWDEVLEGLRHQLGMEPSVVGAGGRGDVAHMSSLGDEWRGPRSTGEAVDELEDTLHGSGIRDPNESRLLAEAGTQIQRGEVMAWARRLGPAWQVLTRETWPAWIRRRFPRGGPDMVAINTAERRIIVGDIAPSAASRVDVRPGMGLGAPASARRAEERTLTRGGDEGSMAHMEKTLDDARRVAAGLPANMRDYIVFAQERYWEAGAGTSALIRVMP